MARRTSLYQAPRSPLIQGRTRWERPLWQPWLGGAVVTGVLLVVFLWVRPTSQGAVLTPDAALAWLVAGIVLGSGLGAALARLWGWRMRWLGASFGGAVLGVGLYALYALFGR